MPPQYCSVFKISHTRVKVPLRVRQFFCFWKLFVALNNCANFFALFRRSALFTTAET